MFCEQRKLGEVPSLQMDTVWAASYSTLGAIWFMAKCCHVLWEGRTGEFQTVE